jgi:Uma2 family endonuclease
MPRATVLAPGLLTAEEYGRRPDSDYPDELVEGKVVPMTVPNRRHGQICNKAGRILTLLAERHRISCDLAPLQVVVRSRLPLSALSAPSRSLGPKR